MNKLQLAALSVAASAFVFSAASTAEEVKIGATPVPHAEILEFIKPTLKAQGLDLTIVEFNDYVQPNLATDEKELDLNFFQHRPYLENFIKDHGVNLVEVGAIHIEPMGVYSSKIKDLKDLKEGASVAIPNDPTNGGRALLLLQSAGLISLEDPKSITATPLDVVKNPKKLDIKELEAPQLPRSLDEVDIAVINTNYAIQAKLNPLKDAIYIEGSDSPYVNIVVGNPESAKKADVKKVVDALKTPEVKKFIEEKYNGAVVPAF
ncbi:MAG: MetQ/NlpA family ABC transporter substrate-binding protein [Succinivibrio sp.]|nr:MetQ/NlpA family ABC transporter substrate-binding protein [Succinivibrio sp.]